MDRPRFLYGRNHAYKKELFSQLLFDYKLIS